MHTHSPITVSAIFTPHDLQVAITSSGDVHFIPSSSTTAAPPVSSAQQPVLPGKCAKIDLEQFSVWGVLQVPASARFLSLSLQFCHCSRCFNPQHTQHANECVVIAKEVKGTCIFYMRIDGSSTAVLVPLHCPPLPADSWLLWCEGGACAGDLSVVQPPTPNNKTELHYKTSRCTGTRDGLRARKVREH
jgi:hypothetical protein